MLTNILIFIENFESIKSFFYKRPFSDAERRYFERFGFFGWWIGSSQRYYWRGVKLRRRGWIRKKWTFWREIQHEGKKWVIVTERFQIYLSHGRSERSDR